MRFFSGSREKGGKKSLLEGMKNELKLKGRSIKHTSSAWSGRAKKKQQQQQQTGKGIEVK